MKLLHHPSEFKEYRRRYNEKFGFVPTMGALHEGHASLLKIAKQECAHVALSIFVNPTQFNNPDDLQKYPRTLHRDLEIAQDCGVDMVFLPQEQDLYSEGYRYRVSESSISKILCGEFRPGHFDGVLSVVMKLFNIVRPTHAYFGEKDFQQLLLIRDMAKAFFMDVEVIGCPTVRSNDGLALSSRNVRLSEHGLRKAVEIPQILQNAHSASDARMAFEKAGFKVDYVEDHWGRRLAAVHLEGVRLIDNIALRSADSND